LNRIEVKVEEKRMVEDDRRWVRGAECDGGKGMHEQGGFCTWSPILALSLAYVKISKSACVHRIALDLAVSGLLNVELMQILKFDIARIKAVECFHLLAFFNFLSIF